MPRPMAAHAAAHAAAHFAAHFAAHEGTSQEISFMVALSKRSIHAAAFMSDGLTSAVLEFAERAGEQGIAMGALVDALEAKGHAAQDVEMVIWDLLGHRRLTPSGFVCRTVARPGKGEAKTRARIYEFLLLPWDPKLDKQLELKLGG
jgi:hypothetical protein